MAGPRQLQGIMLVLLWRMLTSTQHPTPEGGQILPCPGKEDEMAYSDFTLQEVVQQFQLVLEEQHNLFAAVPEVVPGDFLCALAPQ